MNQQNIILDVLARNKNAISLSELSEQLNHAISDRTLRRLLRALAEQGKIRLSGQYRNRKYAFMEGNKEIDAPTTSQTSNKLFSNQSLAILQKLDIPLYAREPCTHNEIWLMSYIPNETFYLSETQRKILAQWGSQTGQNQPAGTYANRIYNRLLIDLSYNSSRLEGNTYSLSETEKLLFEGKAAEDKIDTDRVMILNHKEAIRYLVKGVERIAVNEESIRTLHYLLSDGLVLPQDCGNIRRDSVKISGSVYFPLENPTQIQKILSVIAEKASKITNVFEQSFFLLVHLSYLQAFIDVNKRVARLAANIPLVKNDFIPISFNDIEKEDYQKAIIAIYELNQTLPLSDLFVFSYTKSCKEYQVIYQSFVFDAERIRYRIERRTLIAKIIKEKVPGSQLRNYIETIAKESIPILHQEKFVDDVLDDLYHLDHIKLAGLEVTRQEFEDWQAQAKPLL